jgi:hypothetical protein
MLWRFLKFLALDYVLISIVILIVVVSFIFGVIGLFEWYGHTWRGVGFAWLGNITST